MNTRVTIDTNTVNSKLNNITFVVSACNCKGRSAPVALNLEDNFTDINEDTCISSIPSNETFPVTTPPEGRNNILIVLVYSLCGAVLFAMLVICLVLTLVFIKHLAKRVSTTAHARFLEDEITGRDSTYEEISSGLQYKCDDEMDVLKVNLSLKQSDKSGMIDRASIQYDNITSF